MKVPSDAIVEWRCTECKKPYGYVRVIAGRLHLATMRATSDGGKRWQLEEWEPDARDREQLAGGGMTVSCGRHYSTVSAADIRGKGVNRRKVMLKPERIVMGLRRNTADPKSATYIHRSGSLG